MKEIDELEKDCPGTQRDMQRIATALIDAAESWKVQGDLKPKVDELETELKSVKSDVNFMKNDFSKKFEETNKKIDLIYEKIPSAESYKKLEAFIDNYNRYFVSGVRNFISKFFDRALIILVILLFQDHPLVLKIAEFFTK